MHENTFIGTYGLSERQLELIKANIPTKKCAVMDTDCFTDIIATSEMAVVVDWDKLSDDDRGILVDFYSQVAPSAETLILFGNVDIPEELKKYVSVYPSFESLSDNIKYILLSAYRRSKKSESFSSTLANSIMILNLIRKKPFVTTKEIAENLELSERTVQRYIETLRVAGAWIE